MKFFLYIPQISLLLPLVASGRCNLSCQHGAKCTRSSADNLLHLIQTGHLIDSCACSNAYGGVACDIPPVSCTSKADCRSGDCGPNGYCSELCSLPYQLSEFAGKMCEKPVTEYCQKDGSEYCTNGGKCVNSYQNPGAWDFDPNQQCNCAKEFHGSHCELLKLPESESNKPGTQRVALVSYVFLSVAFLAIGATVWARRYRHKRQVKKREAELRVAELPQELREIV